ncbi:hypothetical protein [Rhizobium sp. GN54]|uniref:hypothetical protein n=1 Tax=Rhizobium sp. GN54 TaxID=2898150 RepID=UPI001E62C322|nr:hypothetical protein [Rhizobium sp. GN54]MCD2184669.1 hypothetical protein [Rhizobium sp. GN54]
MKRYGKIRYPDRAFDVIKDQEMASVLYQFLKSELSEGNILFLMSPFKPKTLYLNFLKDGSPHSLNVQSAILKRAKELGEQELWEDPRWDSIVKEARYVVADLIEGNALAYRFWQSEEFLEYHEKKGGNREDKLVSPVEEAAEELHFKSHELLDAYIKAYKLKGEDATLTVATKLLRSERTVMSVTDFNRFLIDRGLMSASKPSSKPKPATDEEVPPPPQRIELDLKKLKQCGFDNVGGVIIQERCQEMIECYLNKDRQKAIAIYEKILKAEPKNSKLQTTPFVDLIKRFKEKKVYKDLAKQG